jgi:HPr kinase/phosphorylase
MSLLVKTLLKEGSDIGLNLTLACGKKHLQRKIKTFHIQKPGLLLTGIPEELHVDRIQVLGGAEIEYLKNASLEELEYAINKLRRTNLPCLIVTRGLDVPDSLVTFATQKRFSIFITSLPSSIFLERLTKFLEEKFTPGTTIHGVCVDVLGVGILLMGKSGVGKSECALDLITRGHRLVADDVVIIKKKGRNLLMGSPSDIIKYHMEVRGLGIINVKELFGITATRDIKQLDVVVELIRWDSGEADKYERLGFDERKYNILEVGLPHLIIPVSPGRNVAAIVEVAARNQILKLMGRHTGLEFQKRLEYVLNNAPVKKKAKS